MPTSVRLDPETERLIIRLCRRMRRTKSEVIRDAIGKLARDEDGITASKARPYDGLAHLIGIARGGPQDLSIRTGEKLRQLLGQRRGRS